MTKQKNKLYITTGIFLIFLVLMLSLIVIIYNENNSLKRNTIFLNSDKIQFSNKVNEYYNDLQKQGNNCRDPSECIKNPDLAGCHKDSEDCNWCCFSICTLMGCVKND